MLYSLPTGRVIDITLDQYLSMSDDDFQYMVAKNYGDDINDPFHGSALFDEGEEFDPLDLDELPEQDQEELRDLCSLTFAEKIANREFRSEDQEQEESHVYDVAE